MYRAGLRELKLLYASKPRWYFKIVEKTLTEIIASYIALFDAKRFMAGLASPAFFDGLAASAWLDELGGGATTIIATTLKNFIRDEMGLAVVGGKRPRGYKVPEELERLVQVFGFDEDLIARLKYASRMVAKVDNAAIQDGFQLYLHLMLVSYDGEWVIIQQGIKPMTNIVRRYHWISTGLRSFVEEPHSGIVSASREGLVLDMTSRESADARRTCVEAVNGDLKSLKKLNQFPSGQLTLMNLDAHESRKCPFTIPRISWSTLQKIHDQSPCSYEDLLAFRGVGPSMVRFLAAASIELYDVYPSLKDPAILFSEVPEKSRLRAGEKWLYELVEAIKASRLTLTEKRKAFSRLSSVFNFLEECA